MKSEKLDKAVAKVQAKSGDAVDAALAIITGNLDEEQQPADLRELAAMLASGEVEAADQIMEIKEGMMVKGQLLGRGEPALIDDMNKPGTTKEVNTWRMRLLSGIEVTFLSHAQLERQLPKFIGRNGVTTIVRGGMTKTKKNRQMSQFYVVGPKASEGAEDLIEGTPAQ